MLLDDDAAYLAFKARDARFDGRLFIGVSSTQIYCRPICRVRLPRRENCRYFETAAQAEAACFRPCMKCRPEIAPGAGWPWTVMDASCTLARQAALWLDARVDDGVDEQASMPELAQHLGVSDRHLRRIFAAEHGVTPLQYLQTRRLLLAKQLLTDTTMPVAQIALASGFRSLRRFNAAFAHSYRLSPSQLRGASRPHMLACHEGLTVRLGYRMPYHTEGMLRFLQQRAMPGVEAVGSEWVRRSVRAGTWGPEQGWLQVRFVEGAAAQSTHVRLSFSASLVPHAARVLAGVRRWLDLDAAPHVIDPALADLPGPAGLRLPGSVDSFEMAVRAVLGQQVTVAAACTLAKRLVERLGTPLVSPWPEIDSAFPEPAIVAALPLERLAELGITRSRAQAIISLAQAWPQLEPLMNHGHPPADLMHALQALPGIGPWTAHYFAMRALGWPDAFPPNDVAVLKAMHKLFGTQHLREAQAHAQRWQPWRAYAVMRLWHSLT